MGAAPVSGMCSSLSEATLSCSTASNIASRNPHLTWVVGRVVVLGTLAPAEAHGIEAQARGWLGGPETGRGDGVVVVGAADADGGSLVEDAVQGHHVGGLLDSAHLDEGKLLLDVAVDAHDGVAGARGAADGGERS